MDVFRKNCKKNLNIFIWKLIFIDEKIYSLIWNRINFDNSELDLSVETIRIQNFHTSWKLWWKDYWKLLKLLRCRKPHNKSIPNFNSINWRIEWRLSPYLLYFPRNKTSENYTVRELYAATFFLFCFSDEKSCFVSSFISAMKKLFCFSDEKVVLFFVLFQRRKSFFVFCFVSATKKFFCGFSDEKVVLFLVLFRRWNCSG